MTTLLWRIEPTPAGSVDLPHLAEDLILHLRYAAITSVLVQIGSRQQAYISSTGCAGCRQQRCGPACVMQLLRRALIANQAATDLRLVPLGLMKRAYTRLVLAIPGQQAQALDPSILAPWSEARLSASWRMLLGRPSVSIALAVGADGPNPLFALRTHGWLALAAQPLLRPLTSASMPVALPLGWQSPIPASLLLPHSSQATTSRASAHPDMPDHKAFVPVHFPAPIPQAGGEISADLIAQALTTLRQLDAPQLNAQQLLPVASGVSEHCAASSVSASQPPVAQSIDWPAGPANLPPERLEQLVTTLVQSADLTQGQPGRVGLAIPRLKRTLGLTKPEASALLCWLDQAQLLDPPIDPQQPWRQPRQLTTTNVQEIATRLWATPVPTAITISAVGGVQG